MLLPYTNPNILADIVVCLTLLASIQILPLFFNANVDIFATYPPLHEETDY